MIRNDVMVDKLIIKDVQLTSANDDNYFVFEDFILQVLKTKLDIEFNFNNCNWYYIIPYTFYRHCSASAGTPEFSKNFAVVVAILHELL